MQPNSTSNIKTYLIHDNGGRPFKVIINDKNVKIYRYSEYSEELQKTIYDPKELLSFDCSTLFIGNSPLTRMTEYSGGHGPKFDGNSILLHIKNNKYVYIGSSIFSFESFSVITKYVSPVGNNDVPYPYAIDDKENTYLLTAQVIIKSTDKIKKQMKEYDDPHNYYYDYHLITADKGMIPQQNTKIPFFDNIKEFYIGGEPYTMRYKTFPEKDYDRMIRHFGSPISIIDINDQEHILTKESYANIMTLFGEINSFEPLNIMHMYQERL